MNPTLELILCLLAALLAVLHFFFMVARAGRAGTNPPPPVGMKRPSPPPNPPSVIRLRCTCYQSTVNGREFCQREGCAAVHHIQWPGS